MAATTTTTAPTTRPAQQAQAAVAPRALGAGLLLGESPLAGGFLLLFT